MLQQFTYGKSECAQNLVKMLNEMNNDRYTRSVSRFLADNNKIIKQLAIIKDNDVQKTLLNLFQQSVKNCTIHVPEKVRTHAVNVLIGRMRDDVFRVRK